MKIRNNISARPYHTFGTDVSFSTFIEIENVSDLDYLHSLDSQDFRLLGGGSNVLMTQNLAEPVIHVNIKGIEVVKEEADTVLLKLGAGEDWHDVVMWAVNNNYGGIENLSLIPGKCGAAPMQNIGAYGVEIKQVMHLVDAYDSETGYLKTFHSQECAFGYRTSNFKTVWKNKYVITHIVLRLTKAGHHVLNTSYGAISDKLQDIPNPTIKDVSDAVISIRQSKLPDPKEVGNAGSFFKNPIVEQKVAAALKSIYPDMPSYPSGDKVKLAAGWLIDQCGWKGKRVGDTGTYKNQALVIVNHGKATGSEIFEVSKSIQKDVLEKFSIELEPEVNLW